MNNGQEPAFPEPFLSHPNLALDTKPGLTKREYFAAVAMQGLLPMYGRYEESGEGTKFLCADAIVFADELLKQLES